MLQEAKLREALEFYKSGKVSKKELRKKSLKNRNTFCNWLIKFFNANGWYFDLKTANAFLDSLSINQNGTSATPASMSIYMRNLRHLINFVLKKDF